MNDYERIVLGLPWGGYLALDNLNLIADRIRMMIGEGQPYTWVAVNEAFSMRPQVRTSGVATSIEAGRLYGKEGEYGHLMVVDTDGVWSLCTSASNQRSANDSDNPVYSTPYLVFEGGQLTIDHRAPAGHRLCWVVAPEGGAR
ncbi:hypothetical protein ACFYY8_31180 [Streptosporangium sp. NPDC001559]|uniref:hypothetical protein n=1 Tax=Streptosporangium sp. NPDC001559 TaxID=3366187 RepID=UPI0036E6905B